MGVNKSRNPLYCKIVISVKGIRDAVDSEWSRYEKNIYDSTKLAIYLFV
jgi:hypothetical protein